MGPQNQPDYINAVAEIATILGEHDLLRVLQSIEDAQGRNRQGKRWGPRTLDLDLLLFGDKIATTDELTIPHPGLYERAFVLYPLREIVAENFQIPGHGLLADLLTRCEKGTLEIIPDSVVSV